MPDPDADLPHAAAPSGSDSAGHSLGRPRASLVASYVCGAISVIVRFIERSSFRNTKLLARIASFVDISYPIAELITLWVWLAAVVIGTLACAWCLGKGRPIERLAVAPPTIVMLWWLLRALGLVGY